MLLVDARREAQRLANFHKVEYVIWYDSKTHTYYLEDRITFERLKDEYSTEVISVYPQ